MKTRTTRISSEAELKTLIKSTVMSQTQPFVLDDICEAVFSNACFSNYCSREELRKNVILSISKMYDIGYIRNLRNASQRMVYIVD